MLFKGFSISIISGGHLVWQTGTILAIKVKEHFMIISVEFQID